MTANRINHLWKTMHGQGAAGFLFLALAGFALCASHVSAMDGRDFAGTYSVSEASQAGDLTTLTFSMQVFNYSGADVANATVILQDSGRQGESAALFSDVSIAAKESVHLSAQVTVSSSEMDRWQHGSSPRVTIRFTDENGQDHDEAVELAPAVPEQ